LKHAYAYRDWVIASFNADRPFDQFIVPVGGRSIDDNLRQPSVSHARPPLLNDTHDIINDRIDVVTAVDGATVACARCHDHKFDPVSRRRLLRDVRRVWHPPESPRDDARPCSLTPPSQAGRIFLRGNPGNRPGGRSPFSQLLTNQPKPPTFQHGSGRREMAEAIASHDNPLTSRVWVNRVWSHLFDTRW
jgi:hypothetical protein